MDEAQLRREIEAEVRADLERKIRGEEEERARKRDLDAALSRTLQSAQREAGYERSGANVARPGHDTATAMIGQVLAEQMIAGMTGTPLDADGYGDGT